MLSGEILDRILHQVVEIRDNRVAAHHHNIFHEVLLGLDLRDAVQHSEKHVFYSHVVLKVSESLLTIEFLCSQNSYLQKTWSSSVIVSVSPFGRMYSSAMESFLFGSRFRSLCLISSA